MEATIVVQFGQDASSQALVKIELDEQMNVDADGNEKTSFQPGDTPYFLVHHDSTLRVQKVECSSGMVQSFGTVGRARTQRAQWVNTDAVELEYEVSDPSFEWFGNDAIPTVVGRSMTPTGAVPAICDISMMVSFEQFKLIPPELTLSEGDDWPVLVVVTMEGAA